MGSTRFSAYPENEVDSECEHTFLNISCQTIKETYNYSNIMCADSKRKKRYLISWKLDMLSSINFIECSHNATRHKNLATKLCLFIYNKSNIILPFIKYFVRTNNKQNLETNFVLYFYFSIIRLN